MRVIHLVLVDVVAVYLGVVDSVLVIVARVIFLVVVLFVVIVVDDVLSTLTITGFSRVNTCLSVAF